MYDFFILNKQRSYDNGDRHFQLLQKEKQYTSFSLRDFLILPKILFLILTKELVAWICQTLVKILIGMVSKTSFKIIPDYI